MRAESLSLSRGIGIADHHALLLVRVVACHDGSGGLGVAQVTRRMGHIRRNEQSPPLIG